MWLHCLRMKTKFFAALTGVIIITTGCVKTVNDRHAAAVPFVNEPHTYDSQRGKGPIGTFTVFDPDCVRIAFAQIKRETLQESERR